MTQTAAHRRLVRLSGSMNRKAATLGVHGRISVEELLLIEQSGTTCFYCGISLSEGTFDHVIPFHAGGSNTFSNLVRSCLTCNRRKYTKRPDEFESHQNLVVACRVCGTEYTPRWGEWVAGRARLCSRSCAARSRFMDKP